MIQCTLFSCVYAPMNGLVPEIRRTTNAGNNNNNKQSTDKLVLFDSRDIHVVRNVQNHNKIS